MNTDDRALLAAGGCGLPVLVAYGAAGGRRALRFLSVALARAAAPELEAPAIYQLEHDGTWSEVQIVPAWQSRGRGRPKGRA